MRFRSDSFLYWAVHIRGTPLYEAPEREYDRREIMWRTAWRPDERVRVLGRDIPHVAWDVFSLGVSFFVAAEDVFPRCCGARIWGGMPCSCRPVHWTAALPVCPAVKVAIRINLAEAC
jgi:hypothetical protein